MPVVQSNEEQNLKRSQESHHQIRQVRTKSMQEEHNFSPPLKNHQSEPFSAERASSTGGKKFDFRK